MPAKVIILGRLEDKVSRAAVNREVNSKQALTETRVVEANAELQYLIRMDSCQSLRFQLLGHAKTQSLS